MKKNSNSKLLVAAKTDLIRLLASSNSNLPGNFTDSILFGKASMKYSFRISGYHCCVHTSEFIPYLSIIVYPNKVKNCIKRTSCVCFKMHIMVTHLQGSINAF